MKRAVFSLGVVVLAAASPSPSRARPACVHRDARLYREASDHSSLIGTIPAPTPVVLVRAGDKWSMVSYDGETGYLLSAHLSPGAAIPADPPPSRQVLSSERALVREIDPLFGDASTRSRLTRATADYFTGFRRSTWTDRTSNPTPAHAAAGASPCGLPGK